MPRDDPLVSENDFSIHGYFQRSNIKGQEAPTFFSQTPSLKYIKNIQGGSFKEFNEFCLKIDLQNNKASKTMSYYLLKLINFTFFSMALMITSCLVIYFWNNLLTTAIFNPSEIRIEDIVKNVVEKIIKNSSRIVAFVISSTIFSYFSLLSLLRERGKIKKKKGFFKVYLDYLREYQSIPSSQVEKINTFLKKSYYLFMISEKNHLEKEERLCLQKFLDTDYPQLKEIYLTKNNRLERPEYFLHQKNIPLLIISSFEYKLFVLLTLFYGIVYTGYLFSTIVRDYRKEVEKTNSDTNDLPQKIELERLFELVFTFITSVIGFEEISSYLPFLKTIRVYNSRKTGIFKKQEKGPLRNKINFEPKKLVSLGFGEVAEILFNFDEDKIEDVSLNEVLLDEDPYDLFSINIINCSKKISNRVLTELMLDQIITTEQDKRKLKEELGLVLREEINEEQTTHNFFIKILTTLSLLIYSKTPPSDKQVEISSNNEDSSKVRMHSLFEIYYSLQTNLLISNYISLQNEF